MAITIRPIAVADLDVADRLLQAAYGGASRKQRLQAYLQLQPDGWLLAQLDGMPAGVAGAISFGAVGHIGLVGVDPALQRRGVAMALMQELLAWFDARACPVIRLDASDAGAPLYRKLGFVEDDKTVAFSRDDCALRAPAPERVSQLRADELPELVAFDAPIFGAPRGAVLAARLAAAPERAWIRRSAEGQIEGYLFAQPQTLGPWVAHTPTAAEALLSTALELPFEGNPAALVPSSNPHASALLLRYGFSPQRVLQRMHRGPASPSDIRALLYGQASFAIG